jgi:ATP-dependent exoDNAse (exonuclease V) beta subunit
VKIQTVHAAKGLEYPAVFISDINYGKFPSNNSGASAITYRDPIGLRQKKIYRNDEYAYSFDNWRTEILSKALTGDYDEERRLMYVAMTRAEQHLFLSAEEGRESHFFTEIDIESERVIPDLKTVETEEEEHKTFEISGDYSRPKKKSVHSELEVKDSGGKEHGQEVHEFAEMYIKDGDVVPKNQDEEEVKEFIDSLEGELKTEVPIKMPVRKNGEKMVYSGKIDLLNIRDEKVKIVDFKTDVENEQEYRKQLRIYTDAIKSIYSEKKVEASLYRVGSAKKREKPEAKNR